MKITKQIVHFIIICLLLLNNTLVNSQELYTQIGLDPTWQELLDSNAFPIGVNSTGGVTGSTIDVNNALMEAGPNGHRPIPQGIKIHTLCNSNILRNDFHKWTRWYQEDGNTQVFRLFKGEHNVRNDREGAARIESFSELKWGRGPWQEWIGTYTIIKPHGCAIFQAKNNINDWGIMLNLSDNGDITLNHRRHQSDVVIARNMTGKSFHIGVRDNGHDYEVYLNGNLVGTGYYDRPEGTTSFRWGMYDGTLRHDAMIFVTGATINPVSGIRDGIDTLLLTTNTSGQGVIARSPSALKYALNKNVTLTANPLKGWKFIGWSGDITGTQNPITIVMTNDKSITAIFEPDEDKAPYNDTPYAIPGTIEAENYDFGGEMISYHDFDEGNLFGHYRADGVDIDINTNGEYVISNIYPNEWLEYTVEVAEDAYYDFGFIYSSRRTGGKIGAEIKGYDTVLFSGLMVPLTLNWNDYRKIVREAVWLPKGTHVLRINFEREGYNLDKLEITKTIRANLNATANKEISIYPAPGINGHFVINKSVNWEIYSLSGSKLKEGKGSNLDLSGFSNGYYLFNSGTFTKTLINN